MVSVDVRVLLGHQFVGDGKFCEHVHVSEPFGSPETGYVTMSSQCGHQRAMHPVRTETQWGLSWPDGTVTNHFDDQAGAHAHATHAAKVTNGTELVSRTITTSGWEHVRDA